MSLLLGGLLALQAATAPWPGCTDRDHRERPADPELARSLARRFAPILSFAPGERFFPTIPFFTALDGDGAIGDSAKADFEDPWEVAPYLKRPGSGLPMDSSVPLDSVPVAWKELLKAYHPDSGTGQPLGTAGYSIDYALHRVVVLYRVCSLSHNQNKNLERFLRSDEQAFERFQETRSLESILGKASPDTIARFDVIQYFLYYLADRGLQGHPNDIELVSVFLPQTPNAREKFRIIVGSGHSPRTPNNVLVLSAFHRGERKLQDTSHVLVELGGHSSAPDLRPIGRFTPGLDANWHAYDVWGTRDGQAAAGVGYLGQYQQTMTFDRGFRSDGIYVYPPTYNAEEATEAVGDIKGKGEQPVAPPPDSGPGPARPAPQKPDSAGQQMDSAHIYRLVPMHLLVRLDSALNDTANRAEIVSAVSEIQKNLCPSRGDTRPGCNNPDSVTWHSARFDRLRPATQDQAIRAMRRWKISMNRDTSYTPFEPRNQNRPGLPRIVELLSGKPAEPIDARTHRPWEHHSFMGKCKEAAGCKGKADPTEVLKAHLFRPNTYTVGMDGFKNLFLFGATAAPTDGWELYTGIVVPAFRSHGLPVRFGGFLELHLGVNCRFWDCDVLSPTFGILHEAHRNSIVSWYAAGKWVPRRPEVTDRPGAGEFALSGGVSLLPQISENMFSFINVIRIRGGIRFDPFQGEDLLGRVRYEVNFAIRQ